jgi:hypothetical protein
MKQPNSDMQVKGFVRTKRQGWHTYHYLVRSERVNGKVRQRVIAYLGKYESLEEALTELPIEIKFKNGIAESRHENAERWRRAKWWTDIRPGGSGSSMTPKNLAEFREARENKLRFHSKNARQAEVEARRAERHFVSLKKALKL